MNAVWTTCWPQNQRCRFCQSQGFHEQCLQAGQLKDLRLATAYLDHPEALGPLSEL